ncbi:MAG: asparaginase [Thermoplasmatota archaeon]
MDIRVLEKNVRDQDDGYHVVVEERNGIVEGIHHVDAVVVNANGGILYSSGDPYHYTYSRSCIKPIQALPVLDLGAADRFGFTDEEIAIICGSHSGQPEHIETVASLMRKAGIDESMLKCGGHAPFHKESAAEIAGGFGRIHDNCSGKHAGVLALCKHMGWGTGDYINPSHPAQKEIVKAIAGIGSMKREEIGIGIDGCSIPNFAFPIYNMALMFARIGEPEGFPFEEHLMRIKQSMLENRHMVSGTGRFDEVIMEDYPGKVISKAGAMGLQTIAVDIDGEWLGISAKIRDGKYEPVKTLIYHLLGELGVEAGQGSGEKYRDMSVKTRSGSVVGSIRVMGKLMKIDHK